MKRLLTAALALALTFSSLPTGTLTARAEETSTIEAPVEEADAVELSSDDAEEAADPAEAEITYIAEAEAEEEPEIESVPSDIVIGQYARIFAGTAVYDTPDGVCLGNLASDGTVEVLTQENDWARVAVNTDEGALPLWVNAGSIALMGDEQAIEYLNGPASVLAIEPEEIIEVAEETAEEDISEAIETELATAPKATGIKLNASSITIGDEETYKGLSFTVTPADASKEVTWSSSNSKTATVNAKGEVTAHRTGTVTITVKTASGKKDTCKVKVKKAPKSVTVTPTTMKLGYGGMTGKLGVKVSSDYACNTYTYSSSNTNVATVDANGTVTSVNGGSAVITVTAYNGATGTCNVTVTGAPASVKFDAATVTVGTGETVTLSAKAYDKSGNLTETALTYTLGTKSSCVSISADGQLKGLSSGKATIKATAANGVSATCNVEVVAMPVGVKLNQSAVTLAVGESYKGLAATLTPPSGEKTCSAKLTWSSEKTKYATVDASTGEIKGVKAGSSVITVKTSNGLTATCKVTVMKAPGSFSLNPTALTLSAGGMSEALKIVVPSKTGLGGATFTSSNTAVATVDANGVVTSGKEGTATITATAFNGKTAKCTVKVVGEPASVQLNRTAVTVSVGEKTSVTATALTASGNAALTTLTYYVEPASPNPNCVKVDEKTGAITAVASGTAYVNAKTHNGIAATQLCEVKVTAKPKALVLPEKLTMAVGDTLKSLDATLTFTDGTTAPATGLTWSTSNKAVLTVDTSTGTLTALKAGTATITAKTEGGLKATCKLTVTSAPTAITLSPSSIKLSAGGMRFQLAAKVSGVSAANVTYKSSNPAVATVSQSGQITTVKKGSATITASTTNGKTAACTVTVTAVPAKASFTSTQATLTADESIIPYVRVQAADGTEAAADLSFRILAGQKCVDLNTTTGEVTALAMGTAVIGVSTHNGVSASNTFTVKVVAEPTGISLSPTTVTLGAGETASLKANVTAIQGADTSVKWSSSKESVATVNASGKVTAKAIGTATITAQTVNGIKATCQVMVYNAPTTVTLSPTSGSVYVDEVGQYKVKLSSAAAGKVTFTSSDPKIATVDDEGIVYGHAVGIVTITAKSYNGVTGTAKLTVKLRTTSGGESAETNETIERVIALAESKLGVRYARGGYKDANPSSFDCSGLTYWCYYQVGIKIGDTPKKQADDSNYKLITKIEDLRRGDIVCFKSDTSATVNHVGLYRGNGEFVNASESAGKVIVTDINKNYYTRNFVCGRRIIE